MIKNFNWGHGIALFYVCFVALVVTALVASFGVDRSLVVDDYYAKDLAYQQRYDKMSNSISADNVKIKVEDDKVMVQFNEYENIIGSVQFYKASDKSQDFIKPIYNQNLIIPTKNISKGKWSLKIDWTQNGKSFYKEKVIYI